MKSYKYLTIISGIFSAVLIISNTLDTKVFMLGDLALPAGIILFPILLVLWGIYLVDGQLLADRLKRGLPIMQGECGTSWAKPGLSCLMSEPVFSNQNIDECPQEWITKMQQIHYGQQQQHQ